MNVRACRACPWATTQEFNGLMMPICSHPQSFDKDGVPLFLFLDDEPPEQCGLRHLSTLEMIKEKIKGKIQRMADDLLGRWSI